MLYLILVCSFVAVIAQNPLPGDCPHIQLKEIDFDLDKFSGSWFIVASYGAKGRAEIGCHLLEFQKDSMGYKIITTIRNTNISIQIFGRVDLTADPQSKPSFVLSNLHGDKVEQLLFTIVSTDYTDYAIIYDCENSVEEMPNSHRMLSLVLMRQKANLGGDAVHKVQNALKNHTEFAELTSIPVEDYHKSRCD